VEGGGVSRRRYVVVDVFAEEKWAGNPLAVVLDSAGLDKAEMQRIALEFNLSETTFVASAPREGGWDVRIFTPSVELSFAGHPTLGTAWVIARLLVAERPKRVVLNLGVGPVPVDFVADAHGEVAWMAPPSPKPGPVRDGALAARVLGLDPAEIDPGLPVQDWSVGPGFVIAPLRTSAARRRARPDLRELARIGHEGILAVSLEPYDSGHELAVRMFFEAFGAREDPATGSAAACLAAYLVEHRFRGRDEVEVRVAQGREIRRPSLLHLRGRRSGAGYSVSVGGRAFESLRGELA
jgi:trans-2,3-dihydro-3-hydroxyanthranilate isomerase